MSSNTDQVLQNNNSQPQSLVVLRIYDLTNGLAKMFSRSLIGVQLDGVWHTSVEVYGKEYFFHTELRVDEIGNFKQALLVDRLVMDKTEKSEGDLLKFIEENKENWNVNTYHPLENNCNHFTNKLCKFLVNKQIPQYILDMPELAKNSEQLKRLFEMN